jgi:hypothetical protein
LFTLVFKPSGIDLLRLVCVGSLGLEEPREKRWIGDLEAEED